MISRSEVDMRQMQGKDPIPELLRCGYQLNPFDKHETVLTYVRALSIPSRYKYPRRTCSKFISVSASNSGVDDRNELWPLVQFPGMNAQYMDLHHHLGQKQPPTNDSESPLSSLNLRSLSPCRDDSFMLSLTDSHEHIMTACRSESSCEFEVCLIRNISRDVIHVTSTTHKQTLPTILWTLLPTSRYISCGPWRSDLRGWCSAPCPEFVAAPGIALWIRLLLFFQAYSENQYPCRASAIFGNTFAWSYDLLNALSSQVSTSFDTHDLGRIRQNDLLGTRFSR